MTDVTQLIPQAPHGFGFTEDHDLARKEARRFLSEHSTREHVRAQYEDPRGYDRDLYKQALELGWLGLSVPEQYGGAGLDALHLLLLWEELGRALYPSPLFGSALAVEALLRGRHEAQRGQYLPEILSGNAIATFAYAETGGNWGADAVSCRAEPQEGKWVLSGTKAHVPFGASAGLLLVPAVDHKGELGIFILELPAAGIEVKPETSVDPTRRSARVELDRVKVPHGARIQGDGKAIFQRVCSLGYALLAAEMVGASEAVMLMTRDYASDRQQFGRAIGSFQAVKHPIVNAMMQTELARSLVLGAAAAMSSTETIDRPEVAEHAARMAKAFAEEALSFTVQRGVQLHGGFGFTWDCDVQLYFKRMLWSRATLGDATEHRQALARVLFG
ncbi:MAG: acyl-CoA dehydrogenase family protein [Polyangiaceae bacterium]